MKWTLSGTEASCSTRAPIPVDALRLLGGGMMRSVRGTLLDFGLPGRSCAGYFSAYMEFEDGTPVTLVYNGYGYIAGWEMVPWGETPQSQSGLEAEYAYRRTLRAGIANEGAERELARFGADGRPGPRGGGEAAWVPSSPGNIIASCERGEIRQSPTGLYVYDDDGRHDEPLTVAGNVRLNEAAELRRALAGEPIYRDGRWGMATLEAVLAIAQSAAERREVLLEHQVPVVDGLDLPNERSSVVK